MEFIIASNKSVNIPNTEEMANTRFVLINTEQIYDYIKDLRTRFSPLGRYGMGIFRFCSNEFQENNVSIVVFVKPDEQRQESATTDNQQGRQRISMTNRLTEEILAQFADFDTPTPAGQRNQNSDIPEGFIPAFTITLTKHSPVFGELRFCAINKELMDSNYRATALSFLKGMNLIANTANNPFLYYVLESDDPAKRLLTDVFPGRYRRTFPSTAREGIELQPIDASPAELKEKTENMIRALTREQEQSDTNESVEDINQSETATVRVRRRR